MYSPYTNFMKSAEEIFGNVDWILQFSGSNVCCHVDGSEVTGLWLQLGE